MSNIYWIAVYLKYQQTQPPGDRFCTSIFRIIKWRLLKQAKLWKIEIIFIKNIFVDTLNIIDEGQPQPACTCSMLTIETLDQSVKYVQTWISVSIVNFEHVIVGCNYLL